MECKSPRQRTNVSERRLPLIKLLSLQSDRHNYPSVNVRAVNKRLIKAVTEEKEEASVHTNTH